MPLVKYTGNTNPADGTGQIVLESGVLELGGPPVEITDDEFRAVSGRYTLEEVGEQEVLASEGDNAPLSSRVSVSPPTPSPSTPGASGSPPATPGTGS